MTGSSDEGLAPLCYTCLRYGGVVPGVGHVCTAYSDRSIPVAILVSEVDHRRPYAGDGGLTYVADFSVDVNAATRADGDWHEADHPRAKDGKFGLGSSNAYSEKSTRELNNRQSSAIPFVASIFKEHQVSGRIKEYLKSVPSEKLRTAEKLLETHAKRDDPQANSLKIWVQRELDDRANRGVADGTLADDISDPDKIVRAAGILFITPDDEVLLVRRTAEGEHKGKWSLPGGKLEDEETAEEAARREAEEEVGWADADASLTEHTRQRKDGVDFTTFLCKVPARFEPRLNAEHDKHAWMKRGEVAQGTGRGDSSEAWKGTVVGKMAPAPGDLVSVESDAGKISNAPWTSRVLEADGWKVKVAYDDGEDWYELDPDVLTNVARNRGQGPNHWTFAR